MRKLYCLVLVVGWAMCGHAQSNSYLFVWAGDDAKASNDFLGVIDADAKSPHYGQVVASVAVPGPTGTPHHTELEMPDGGFLLANAFESGRTEQCSRRRRVARRARLENSRFAGDQARIIQLIALLSTTAGRNNIHRGRSNSMVKQPIANGGLKADLRSFITHSSFRITDWGDVI